jgi:hypothetical protein
MKLLFFWVLVAVHAYGQGTDSLIHSPKLLVLIDSVAGTAKNNLDTVSILKACEKTNSDSIGLQQGLNDYSIRLNALESKLRLQIDSLSQFSIRDSLTFLHIRYLKSTLDSINNLSRLNRVAQSLQRVETLERKVSGKIDSVKSKINQKLSLFSRGEGNVPDVNKLDGTSLNGSLNIDSNLTALDGDVPAMEDPLENINAPEIGVNGIPGDLPNLPNTGAASNSVNLFTGDVALPLNLVSLPGANGLDVNVSIAYNSNVQNIVDTWNLEAPTGILGLGWSMDIPKIVADHKQTGAREDDTYYLLEGGSSNRLVRTASGTDASGPYYVYETQNYQFWKIKYYYDISEITGSSSYGDGPNKWVITKEDGTTYIYGDKDSGRNTLQYTVRWQNWIGNSAQIDGQSQLVHAWNLSEIINTWSNRITFEYDNVEQFVGSTSGQKQTEASYLKKIADTNGKKISFFYNEKDPQFYLEPHIERPEPDAYQEFYERRYLDHIDVSQEAGLELFSIHFAYRSVNGGTATAKMVLASIAQRSPTGNYLPPLQFEYFTSGSTVGFLKRITYPTGGTVSYEYTQGTIAHSDRQFTASAPAGYAEPKVWIAEDYVVVTWRELSAGNHATADRQVKLYVYQWVGEWKEQFLQTITGVALSGAQSAYYDYKDFQVVIQKDFFAVLSRASTSDFYHLFIKYKDAANRGQ